MFVKDLEEGVKWAPLFDVTFPNFSKQFQAIYCDQTTIESAKLGTMHIFEVNNLIFCYFSKIWKFNNPCEVIKSKLGQKGPNFYYYILTVIKN